MFPWLSTITNYFLFIAHIKVQSFSTGHFCIKSDQQSVHGNVSVFPCMSLTLITVPQFVKTHKTIKEGQIAWTVTRTFIHLTYLNFDKQQRDSKETFCAFLFFSFERNRCFKATQCVLCKFPFQLSQKHHLWPLMENTSAWNKLKLSLKVTWLDGLLQKYK